VSIVHHPLAGSFYSFYKALALTATLHAGLAGLLSPSTVRLTGPDGHMVNRPVKNTRPVVLAQMPSYFIPVSQRPERLPIT
jgi:hypothetical protein